MLSASEGNVLDDLINILIILGFFALTWAFVRLCDRLWGGPPC